jgi:outer membrane protein assembly factor BamB
MARSIFAGVALALLLYAVPARCDDDPEPAVKGAEARSGDYVVKLTKKGELTARKKQGKQLWSFDLRASADKPGDVAISGQRVVAAQAGSLAILDLETGKALWQRTGADAKTKISVNGDRLTVTSSNRREVIDLPTGKLLEVTRFKN